ncbi:unnamed protein product, partial [Mycena citricolor]
GTSPMSQEEPAPRLISVLQSMADEKTRSTPQGSGGQVDHLRRLLLYSEISQTKGPLSHRADISLAQSVCSLTLAIKYVRHLGR